METQFQSGVPKESRRRKKTVWRSSQKAALRAAFAQNPYPSFGAREDLAREFGLPESRVQVWFQNRRARQLRSRSSGSSGDPRPGPARTPGGAGAEGEAPPRHQPPEGPAEPSAPAARAAGPPPGGRRQRSRFSAPQIATLVRAFQTDRFPGFAAREELARQTGLPEDRIHVWFLNRRARHPERKRADRSGRDGTGRAPEPQLAVLPGGARADSESPAPVGAVEPPASPVPPGEARARASCLLDQLLEEDVLAQQAEAFLPAEGEGGGEDHQDQVQVEDEAPPEPPLCEEDYQNLLGWLGEQLAG